jgi:hypothetical protein
MEIKDKTVLVLGSGGMVGMAVCRELMLENPALLVISSLKQQEVEEVMDTLKAEFPNTRTRFAGVSGNIFGRMEYKDKTHKEILEDPECRKGLIEDILGELNEEVLERFFFYRICQHYKPEIVIDCVNSATAISYQDIFLSSEQVLNQLNDRKGFSFHSFSEVIEKHLCTLLLPQLIRHVQIFYESMKRVGTKLYFKIGTSGTGGMGLNIPYTHSEERPSRVLLSKSAIAGAHTLLLFLMARTPDAPITKEIKPTALIAWKGINYGPIIRQGKPVILYDCPPSQAFNLEGYLHLEPDREWNPIRSDSGDPEILHSVYIDTGENGIFSRAEFEAITSIGQMEFVTPEEIARNMIYEIKGRNTGCDVINALDNATMGPTYRAGSMRHNALERMQELECKYEVDSVAFEMLGPPRISKLLYEAYLLKLVCSTLSRIIQEKPTQLSHKSSQLIATNQRLRSSIISIGIPILLPDGKSLLRGPEIKIPRSHIGNEVAITREEIDKWAHDGWVDLRVSNMELWQRRIRMILEEIATLPPRDTSSRFYRDTRYWGNGREINVGKLVSWILVTEEHGERIKG